MKANIYLDKNFIISLIDDRIYSSFVEHVGRQVYGGLIDEKGFRDDVIGLVKKMNLKMVRYPGGNFVSALDWEDTIGPKNSRPVRFDVTMSQIEDNSFGLDEFLKWTEAVGVEPMLCINLGTKGIDEARNIVEYCNFKKGTYYSDLRIKNGHEKPYNVKLWCLGNEMDGPWQIGHKTAREYGKLANECAKIMKLVDPTIEVVCCGSSYYMMPTFGDWEAEVLEECYENIDYIALHSYFSNKSDYTEEFLGKSIRMAKFIEKVASICDYVGAKKRSDKVVNISFDEWNVWDYVKSPLWTKPCFEKGEGRIEQDYTFEDALLVSSMIMTLINHSDRVKISCISELVNSIAPIKTEGDMAYCQTTFYPFYLMSKFARGTALRSVIECEKYSTNKISDIPYIDSASVIDYKNNKLIIAILNRSLDEDTDVKIKMSEFNLGKKAEHILFNHEDLKAINTVNNPENVTFKSGENVDIKNDLLEVTLEKHSFNLFLIDLK